MLEILLVLITSMVPSACVVRLSLFSASVSSMAPFVSSLTFRRISGLEDSPKQTLIIPEVPLYYNPQLQYNSIGLPRPFTPPFHPALLPRPLCTALYPQTSSDPGCPPGPSRSPTTSMVSVTACSLFWSVTLTCLCIVVWSSAHVHSVDR